MLTASDFLLSYKKKFVTKFVTKNILADSKKLLDDREKFQQERKKSLGDEKEISQARIDFKQGRPTHRVYINMYAPFSAENT